MNVQSFEADPLTAIEMFERRLQSDPDAVVLLTPDGVGRTYRQLAERAALLMVELRNRGITQGDVVGLYLGNEPNWVVAVLACWWCGSAFAACGAVSPRSEAERRFSLVRPRLVLCATDVTLGDSWPVARLSREGLVSDSLVTDAYSEEGLRSDRILVSPDDIAAIFFTSGTTGGAKATIHTHERLAENARATASAYAKNAAFRPRVAPGVRPPAVSFSPFGHLAAVGRLIFRVYVGRSLLIVPRFEVPVFRELARQYSLDTLQLAPAMLHALAFAPESIDLGSLKYVTSGTAPLPIATRDAFEQRYGVPVLQAYGSTEGAVTARERFDDVKAGRRGPGSVGRVDEGTPVRIVDPQGKDASAGQDGEIIGRPDLSRSSRYLDIEGNVSLPLDADGWYHTGDIGHFDKQGILYITGRLKEVLVVGGFNVFPAEIEDALRELPLVRDAVVVSVADDRLGEVPAAGIVWETGDRGDLDVRHATDQLSLELRKILAPYKVPRRWFTLRNIPLNGNGKIDRQEATKIAASVMETENAL